MKKERKNVEQTMPTIELKPRGTPPYTVWNDTEPRIFGGSPLSPQEGYTGNDFLEALAEIFDITDGGLQYLLTHRIAHIRDTNGEVVFSCAKPEDLQLLFEIDVVGFLNVVITSALAE